jgi:hypothetical protein
MFLRTATHLDLFLVVVVEEFSNNEELLTIARVWWAAISWRFLGRVARARVNA